MSNRLDPDQARRNVRHDLGPTCLQRLLADDTTLVELKYNCQKQEHSEEMKYTPEYYASQLIEGGMLI